MLEIHYKIIADFYRGKTAKRSSVPYINHIDEGLRILDALNADELTKAAYCVHPLFQSTEDMKNSYTNRVHKKVHPTVLMLAMEYRNTANAFLCRPETDGYGEGDLPGLALEEIRLMLIADKVQNYKDFLIHQRNTHERGNELSAYFKKWLWHLGVEETVMNNFLKKAVDSSVWEKEDLAEVFR